MAFYLAIKGTMTPKIVIQTDWIQDPEIAINFYDVIRASRIAATVFEFPTDSTQFLRPYSSIRVIGGA